MQTHFACYRDRVAIFIWHVITSYLHLLLVVVEILNVICQVHCFKIPQLVSLDSAELPADLLKRKQ